MSGIYLHIPFCKQACHYCNFHFSTSLKYKDAFLSALLKEIVLQQTFFSNPDTIIETVYFGGGTPSLLSIEEIKTIFNKLQQCFHLSKDTEITLEANPDDLSLTKLKTLKQYTPINRLSIGVQSFQSADLLFMNRAHNVEQAHDVIQNALKTGFDNLTIDLIYGTPTMSMQQWKENLNIVFQYNISHISAYCLTVEPKTALHHFVKTGKAADIDEEMAARQFEYLVEAANKAGYEQYEISNFCKPGYISRHNSSYWTGKPYLGLGPAAHSFQGNTRQWNVANNIKYIKRVEAGIVPFEKEILTIDQQFNEYLMTALRTQKGCDLNKIEKDFGHEIHEELLKNIKPFLAEGLLVCPDKDIVLLSQKGKFVADGIISALMRV